MAAPIDVKLDFNQFKRAMMDEYGENNCDLDPVKKIVMVTFRKIENGNVTGFWNGCTIYRDRESVSIISEDETWFCELKPNPNNSRQYFARAVEKVDARFLYDLRKDQLDELAEVVWEGQRSSIEPELEMFYKDRIESRSKEIAGDMVAEIGAERDAMAENISTMTAERESMMEKIVTIEKDSLAKDDIIEELKLGIADKEAEIELLKDRIDSLLCELGNIRAEHDRAVCELEKERCKTVHLNIRSASDAIIRMDRNTLYSARFLDGRYKVRFSSDRKRMRIEFDDDGESECSNNQLKIEGLCRMCPFTEPGEITFEDRDGVLEARLC